MARHFNLGPHGPDPCDSQLATLLTDLSRPTLSLTPMNVVPVAVAFHT